MTEETKVETPAPATAEQTTPVAKKKPRVRKKPATGKTAGKKTAAKKPRVAKASRKSKAMPEDAAVDGKQQKATDSRQLLIAKLKQDLKEAKKTLKVARVAARDEIEILKDHLNAALKREKELLKISEKKAKKMLAAGARWEKKQVAKIIDAAKTARKLL